MNKFRFVCLSCLLAIPALTGCGSGGGLNLTGGSVPIGGRAATGIALSPDSSPVANAVVAVQTLQTGVTLQTTQTDDNGRFSLSSLPVDKDILVVVNQPPTKRLAIVVSRVRLATNPNQSLDIGSVTALTTLEAEAIGLEQAHASDESENIVSDQSDNLRIEIEAVGYSQDTQSQFINDRTMLSIRAMSLIVPALNSELDAYVLSPNSATGATALRGLLGYLRVGNEQEIHPSFATQSELIAAQISNKTFSINVIVSALKTANVVEVTPDLVQKASQQERANLSGLKRLGNNISVFEAIAIAGDIRSRGGFGLEQEDLNVYLNTLLRN